PEVRVYEVLCVASSLLGHVPFVDSQRLLLTVPDSDAQGMERAMVKRRGVVFAVGRGGKLRDGHRRDMLAPYYDDWSTPAELGHA
ncbi:hypothetical protein GLP06_23490, partial [Escherichia coli]|nr:hypothetical protein [Escherichia coli]